MRPLKHGYTNRTLGDGSVVVKTYEGPDAEFRFERERTLLTGLAGRLPVPPVHAADDHTLTLGFVEGVPGQELLDAGNAQAVLHTCGRLLRRLHAIPADALPLITPAGVVRAGLALVHGDYGPNNLLIDPGTFEVTAVLDWEFAHPGDPIEDLAWCEWIVRTHHPEQRGALSNFFDAYGCDLTGGAVPSWPLRKAAMLAKCESLRDFCQRWEPNGPGVKQWLQRIAATASWSE
jgi:aminoglycoside phosphotransferase